MKRRSRRKGLSVLVAVMAVGVLFFGCGDSGNATLLPNTGTAPILTEFVTLTRENAIAGRWEPASSFPVSHGLNVGMRITDPEQDVVVAILTFFKEGEEILQTHRLVSQMAADNVTRMFGGFPKDTASEYYSVSVYVIDARGNVSNTMTTLFVITEE